MFDYEFLLSAKLCVFWNNFVEVATFHIQPIPAWFSRKDLKIKSHDSKQSQSNNSTKGRKKCRN